MRDLSCPVCGEVSASLDHLHCHVADKHCRKPNEEPPYRCACGKGFGGVVQMCWHFEEFGMFCHHKKMLGVRTL